MTIADSAALRIVATFLLGTIVLEAIPCLRKRVNRIFNKHTKNKEQEMEK